MKFKGLWPGRNLGPTYPGFSMETSGKPNTAIAKYEQRNQSLYIKSGNSRNITLLGLYRIFASVPNSDTNSLFVFERIVHPKTNTNSMTLTRPCRDERTAVGSCNWCPTPRTTTVISAAALQSDTAPLVWWRSMGYSANGPAPVVLCQLSHPTSRYVLLACRCCSRVFTTYKASN